MDSVFSDFLDCGVGVPQGSNLGPLLFLLFFNDLPRHLTCQVEAYADDSTLSAAGRTIEEVDQVLTENCQVVSKWMCQNRLKLNASKTHVMTLGTTRKLQSLDTTLTVEMDGIVLEESSSKVETLLGCSITPNLKWHKHIEELSKKLKKRLAGLESLRYTSSLETRKKIAQGIFMSVLTYCLPLFSGCDKHSVASLQILQNKAARIVTRSPLRTSRKEMFGCLQWLTVRQLMFYHSALTTFRVKQSHEPEYLSGILSRENHRGKIIIPHSMLSLAMQSYCFRGSAEWNTLPQSIRRLEKLSKFKEELKKWIFLNIEAF